ncbi:potassium channel tetramerisation domain-containing protein / pentapeptide repeat-containing protein [Prunus dulcis]|uniref:Potassium channel tetramerisation domain-containing protein / pentapeptide repeat-containing protein n=1 Tax=Prunus dulcis TaxID=3755 RepID=A0A4Y1RJH3_PRUDU|nr:potassium channel tetramerisation domain-containing protein / pentapeptide repeat-containing protein [Prunus dulcis]
MAMELKKSSVIRLNVGGNKFCTSVDTLTQREPNSMLAAMFSGRHNIACEEDCEKGYVFIDRDGTHFRHILNWLRDATVPLLEERCKYSELLREAEYFQLVGLTEEIHAFLNKEDDDQIAKLDADFTRRDIINFILSNATMKFRGFNLSGLDLSKLDLTKIDFSYACLRNVCFSGCDLTRVKFNYVDAEGAIFNNATLTSTEFVGANLRDASFVDAKLRFAKIKSACLVNCSFLRAILYNAHLYDADLTNANFEAASLECAALKNLKATNTANFTDAYLISSGVQDVNLQHLVGAKLGVVTACGNGFICKKPDEIR